MNIFKNLKSGIQSLLGKQRVERELDEELDSYLAASIADKQRSGLDPATARRAAHAEIGSRNSVKHQVWSAHWESTLDNLVQDTRLSLRSLLKSPGFTLIALLSLALGIGANTAIFTLIHQVLLRNLPVQHPEQLVLFGRNDSAGVAGGIDLGDYGFFPWYFTRQLQSNPGPFQGIASYGSFNAEVSIRVPGASQSAAAILAPASIVSGNYFSVLGARPMIGRAISPEDEGMPGSGAVVVLSHRFWQQSLASDPAILGKILSINSTPYAVIGVMPPAFLGLKQDLGPTDLWTPISMQPQVLNVPSYLTPTGPYFLHAFARLSPQAAANKSALAQSQNWLDQQIRNGIRANSGAVITPDRQQEISRHTVPLLPASHGVSEIRNQYGDSLQILMAVVALVLLIACANLANFLLARAATRQREIATRLALGSSRGRIIRQGLMETLLLSLTGGAAGLAFAFAATRALVAFVSQGEDHISIDPTPDVTVLLFTLGISLATALLFGLAPALATARTSSAVSLSSNARNAQSSGGRASRFWPKTLVTAQVMLSLLLLVGAGLFLRTLNNLQNQDYGFERTHLLVVEFDPSLIGYKPHQAPALHQQLIDRLSALPGVRSVALSATPPISGGNWSSSFKPQGYTPAPKESVWSPLNRVTDRYFETAGIAIVAGRSFNSGDTLSGLKVAIVNQTVAQRYFPKGDAIGRQLTMGIDNIKGPWRIVGIARDTKSGDPHNTKTDSMIYFPLAQMPPFNAPDPAAPNAPLEENQDQGVAILLVRTTGDPAQVIGEIRPAFAGIDPNLPIIHIHTIHEEIDSFMSHDELISRLTGIFALLALLLAAIGLYGVISYSVIRRTSEIGIRLALGAQTRAVLWMVLRESLLLLAIGLALGLPLAFASTRLIREQLFGITALDPSTFAVAIAVVAAMTVFAAWLPARRATKVDPMIALRCD